jgi:hypothetical protein
MTGYYEEKRNGDKNVHVYIDTPSNPTRVNGVPWYRSFRYYHITPLLSFAFPWTEFEVPY